VPADLDAYAFNSGDERSWRCSTYIKIQDVSLIANKRKHPPRIPSKRLHDTGIMDFVHYIININEVHAGIERLISKIMQPCDHILTVVSEDF
jgi:hypothetical protein